MEVDFSLQYRNMVEGLCGNMNRDIYDEFRTADGGNAGVMKNKDDEWKTRKAKEICNWWNLGEKFEKNTDVDRCENRASINYPQCKSVILNTLKDKLQYAKETLDEIHDCEYDACHTEHICGGL